MKALLGQLENDMTTAKTATQYRKAWKAHARELWFVVNDAALGINVPVEESLVISDKALKMFEAIDEMIELAIKANGLKEEENEKA